MAVVVESGSQFRRIEARMLHQEGLKAEEIADLFGVSPEHQVVQDYRFARGEPLNDVDVRQRRHVVVIGADIGKKLFEDVDPIGRSIRIRGEQFVVGGLVAPKGRVLGQSFDGFVMLPISTFESLYGRRQTTSVSVKMRTWAAVSWRAARLLRVKSTALNEYLADSHVGIGAY